MTAVLPADLLAPADAEGPASAVLQPMIERFVNGAAGDGLTLRANRAALDAICVVPRVLRDVSATDSSTVLLGAPCAVPAAVAPMAYQHAFHPDGELAVARAARDAGMPFTVSTFSSVPVEEIAAAGGTTWFQLYWLRDRGVTADLLARAESAGCSALVLTVDTPRMGRRQADLRGSFRLPDGVRAAHFDGSADGLPAAARTGVSAIASQTAGLVDPSLSWRDLEWLRERTRLPLVLKGILDPRDAAAAAGLGADAIVVSNHGGRQLDGAQPAITALPAVAAAVAGRCEVLFDSGIRSGTDILKALALGAGAVLVGRPVLWGLAAAGQAGVHRVLDLFRTELHNAMALAGCPDLAAVAGLATTGGPVPATAAGSVR
ncbi:alpha-hydroxy acid oxidase [Actinacidiphila rubida]|uniref:4-hydroxymandelate oxidase n=1 Tax=Actinacidiphila rubida TaxID=310780 RepID=A0A1H8EH16_9ACTN|nr:alpha-hydroxy acid oxidase [Actinacidiphila rubida]SEN18789.1 4-hydroxymandelate oxidase [Actinacidiphila rubida]